MRVMFVVREYLLRVVSDKAGDQRKSNGRLRAAVRYEYDGYLYHVARHHDPRWLPGLKEHPVAMTTTRARKQ